MNARALLFVALYIGAGSPGLSAQGVVVDEGTFAVSIGGVPSGTEEFVIRRPGVGREDALFANGVVTLTLPEGRQEMRPLLHAMPPDGVAMRYQISATGFDAIEVQVARSGRRYLATIRSDVGAEDREFQAHGDTRVLERHVAHHYYFLRDLRADRPVHTLEPRTGSQGLITAGEAIQVTIRLGLNQVQARRVPFTTGTGETRTAWYDRQGRVLRVEVPALRFVAERTDLVG
ncbi:MAG: hypothetical protein L7S64_05035 [Longimicrobiales bacterium]|nr:hypothetical protein [Longimicrobiales bacterium]